MLHQLLVVPQPPEQSHRGDVVSIINTIRKGGVDWFTIDKYNKR